MSNIYTARVYRNEGRKSFSVSFRHPLKTERGKVGRKVCKGLGTENEKEAEQLRDELNNLLAAEKLHSQASKQEAIKQGFDKRVVDIFYDGLDPAAHDHRVDRERFLELPTNGHTRTLLLGITGAGKTTLLRRLIGTDAKTERFPTTAVNRTTTCPTEIITGGRDYRVVVTFLSQHQTQQEVIESLSAAVLEAVEDGDDERVMNEFLEQSDMRFRLKYVLGGWGKSSDEEEFSFSDDDASESESDADVVSASEAEQLQKFLQTVLGRVQKIAHVARKQVEEIFEKKLSQLEGDERDYALDEIQEEAEQSDTFLDLVSDVMSEIQERFAFVQSGEFEKTSTGWPVAWSLTEPASRRKEFLNAIRWFSGNAKPQWGRLLTPIVSGIRVRGPFKPIWAGSAKYEHVFIDTEGLAHAKASADVPNELTSLFKSVDNILLVESAKNALHSPAAAKVFEAVSSTGYTPKFALTFTHMDHVSGENLRNTKDKREHVFGGVRNVLDNQVAKNVSRDAARQLENHLQTNTFYFDYLDPKKYPTKDESKTAKFETVIGKQLNELTICLASRTQPDLKLPAYPIYSMHSLGIAVREGSQAFVESWEARLGFKRVESFPPAPWQSIKALSRRYAEGWWDGYKLQPVNNLVTIMRNVLSKFLDTPMDWRGRPNATENEKIAAINRVKNEINEVLTRLAEQRLREKPLPEWQYAYGRSGTGSTFERRHLVRNIFQVQVPIPNSVSDKIAQEWIEIFQKLIEDAVALLRKDIEKK